MIEIRTTQKTTQIESIAGGVVQYFDNKVVQKIVCVGEFVKVGTSTVVNNANKLIEVDEHKFEGTCTIHFHGKPPKEFNNNVIDFDTLHTHSFGIPVSEDGSKLFVGSWYKVEDGVKKGLRAYDTETGSLLWRLNEGKICETFVYSDCLIVLKANSAIFKVSIDNGEILEQVKSGTIEQIFDLGIPYVLADTVSGKLSVIDTKKMLVVKKYKPKQVNPNDCLSLVIQRTILQDNTLTIFGFEEYPNSDYSVADSKIFDRIIDTNFYAL
jgi:outer membrane protein assembly factor BamB